jgi:hypothetical protein
MKLRNASIGLLGLFMASSLGIPASVAVSGAENPRNSAAASCTAATESVQQLAKIVNSRDDSFHCVGLVIGNDAITAIRFETHGFMSDQDGSVSERVKIIDFPVGLIESNYGAVLDGEPGHDAVILQGRFSRPTTTADLVIRYLYDGFTGGYRSCEVTLDRAADSHWHLMNARHENISRILVRTWSLPFIGVAGIANLDGACASKDVAGVRSSDPLT